MLLAGAAAPNKCNSEQLHRKPHKHQRAARNAGHAAASLSPEDKAVSDEAGSRMNPQVFKDSPFLHPHLQQPCTLHFHVAVIACYQLNLIPDQNRC